MFRRLEIEHFRGFQALTMDGLSRVNLVIGRNDVGKTSLIAAASQAYSWSPALAGWTHDRYTDPSSTVWRSLFHRQDVGTSLRLVADRRSTSLGFDGQARAYVVESCVDGEQAVRHAADATGPSWRFAWWSPAHVEPVGAILDAVIELYRSGRSDVLAEAVRLVNPSVRAVDVVGQELFVKLDDDPIPYPIGVLGDGSRRILEFALGLASCDHVAIDEIENGFHWTSLEKVCRLLQGARPEVQVFATTHRDELIQIACETFLAAGDGDSLRIIRLDRTSDGHRAVVYPAEVALHSMASGLEIRG
jgi:hypothetical protein